MVNYDVDTPYVVPTEALQSKATRYYYQESILLNEGEYYISELDLNIENNVVEEPYKRVMRFSTPLYNGNDLDYVLIININVDRINYLFDFLTYDDDFKETMIVNEEGYYIYHTDTNQTFGWLVDERSDASFNNDYAFIEEGYSSIDNNSIEYGDLVIHKSTIDPFFLNENVVSNFTWDIINITEAKNFDQYPNLFVWNIKANEHFFIASMLLVSIGISFTLHLRKKDQNELTATRKISSETNDAIVISDTNGRISYVNKAFEQTTGFLSHEVIGLKTNTLQSGIHGHEFYISMWSIIEKTGIWSGEVWNKRKDGIYYPKQMTVFALNPNKKKKERRYIAMSSELKDLSSFKYKMNNVYFEQKSNKSSLINAFSESAFIKQFQLKSVILIQIKNLHETQSVDHELTNKINSEIISKLKNKSQYISFISQITKNLFIIGISELENIALYEFIENLLHQDLNTVLIEDNNVYLDIYSGISFISETQNNKCLVEEASIALEYCLENPTHKHQYYSNKIVDYFKRQMKIDYLLREAIDTSELSMVYQPQFDCKADKMTGVEALIRWKNKELGNISPTEFIPVAEKSGYIVSLGYWIIEKVFIDCKKFIHKIDEDFRFSINISPLQFKDQSLMSKLIEFSKKHDVPLTRFEIEITETLFADDIKMINRKLQKLRNYGLKISVDDFGTGYSSLSYLQELSLDKLKIDRSFISDYPDKNSGAILHSIISLASQLELDIICEGVETKLQKEYLQSIKCSKHQGYLYSKPIPLNELDEIL